MADTIVRHLKQHMKQLLIQEPDLLEGVVEQFKQLYNNLNLLSFLTEFEEKWREENIAKEVVSLIRDKAEEAEDIIDLFINNVKQQRKSKNTLTNVFNIAVYYNHNSSTSRKCIELANQKMKRINFIFRDIYEKQAYCFSRSSNSGGRAKTKEPLKRLIRTTAEREETIGLEDDKDMVVKQLLGGKDKLDVVSIYGMGGIGKTTLAKIIYEDPRVKDHFYCTSWVTVTRQYEIGKVYEDILRQKSRKSSSSSSSIINEEIDLKDRIVKYLKNSRFLLVLDDVWDHQVLKKVILALPDTSNRSRVLITSRIHSVALYAGQGIFQYSMPFLTQEESWRILCNMAFRGEKCCPPELEAYAREIVERCGGLPISLLVLGGISACREESVKKWSELVNNLDLYLTHHTADVLDILAPSYNDLPWRLKLCFMYMVIYPQSFEIPMRQLIQLWVAEGFIQHADDKTPEDVAEDYLAELIDRSLVVLSTKRTDGGVKTCRVHHLFRLFCVIECQKSKFLELCTDANILSLTKPRRLTLHRCTIPLYIASNPPKASCLRSLLCFGSTEYRLETCHFKWLSTNSTLIRVLNLGRVQLKAIPDSLKRLVHLKYLKIESRALKVIPPSIGNLVNLQTLDLRYSKLNFLPAQIWKMRELRHLYVYGPVSLVNSKYKTLAQISWNLLGLSTVALDEITAQLIKKALFPNLRKLGLRYDPNSKCSPNVALAHLYNLKHLRTLKIYGSTELPTSAQAFPQNIAKITLVQEAESFSFPSNAITTLSQLPYLGVLKLLGPDKGVNRKKLEFNCDVVNGFPLLECLQMSRLQIEKPHIEIGSMPCLRNWTIKDCTWLSDSREVQRLHLSSSLAVKFGKFMEKNGGHLRID